MSARTERTLRIVDLAAGERPPRPSDYWRTRPLPERLAAVLELHREGNELFWGGNPPFAYTMEIRRAEDRR